MIIIYDSLRSLRDDDIELLDDSDELDSNNYFNILISSSTLSNDLEKKFVRYNKLLPSNRMSEFIKKNKNHIEIVNRYLETYLNKFDIQLALGTIHLANMLKDVRIIFNDVDILYVNHIKDFTVEKEKDVKLFFSVNEE